MNNREIIAKRIAKELKDNSVVNLGYGIPVLIPRFIEPKRNILLQGDNGVLGIDFQAEEERYYYKGVAGENIDILPCGSFFSSRLAFDMIGAGLMDYTVLGALQVDQLGNIASHVIPGKFTPGMGGAMDLLAGAKKVFVAMEHTNKGEKKILRKCNFPLTGSNCVDMIFTEMAVFKFTDKGMELIEIREGISLDQVKVATEADFTVYDKITTF